MTKYKEGASVWLQGTVGRNRLNEVYAVQTDESWQDKSTWRPRAEGAEPTLREAWHRGRVADRAARLVDHRRSALIQHLDGHDDVGNEKDNTEWMAYAALEAAVDDLRAALAEAPAETCKDCRWFHDRAPSCRLSNTQTWAGRQVCVDGFEPWPGA